jgi:hypothetical protein
MPAIQPAKLKKQVSDLTGKFNQPAMFVRDLHALLDLYTDHTHRPGQAGEPSPLIAAYQAPPPVMHQVWHELMPLIKQQPDKVLPLCDALWAEPNYDLQLLAARLLGQVPVDSPQPVIDRLHSWVQQGIEKSILDGLFEYGLVRLKQDAPNDLLELVTTWMGSAEHTNQQAGLRSLLPIISQSGTEHLPSIFRLLTPYLRVAPTRLRPDILTVLTALAHSSPFETAYLLRQNLSAPNNPDTAWLIRHVLDEFPEDAQAGLRLALKEKRGDTTIWLVE